MNALVRGAGVLVLLILPSCSDGRPAAPAAAPTFVNRVWAVAESKQVAPGELRVFLSEGTLVMAAPHATPALGSWRRLDERLMIVEEGLEYQVDILELANDSFRIRMHSPGEPVEILFRPASADAETAGGDTSAIGALADAAGRPEPLRFVRQ
jgi:hypothetical protein